jgi:hypothetical protein
MHPKPSSHSGRIVGKQEVIQKRASRQLSGLVTSRHLVRKSSIDEMRVYGYSCCLVLFIASAGTRFAFLSWDSLASSHLWPLPQGQLSPEIGSRGSLRRRSVGIALLVLAIIPFGDMSIILCVVELPQQLLGHWLGKPCAVGTGFPEHQVRGVITHSHFLDPLHHCHGFLRFIRFHKIRLTCSNSAANRGNSEIHSLDEPAAQRSGTRQQNVFPYHSGRQATAATPSARPGPGQGRSIGFQLRPASPDLKRPRLLAA